MAQGFFQNALLRSTLIGGYRTYARVQFWRKGPRVLINSIPKSGTHLLTSELNLFPQMQNSGLWIEWQNINRLALKGERMADFELDEPALQKAIDGVRNGQYFATHFAYRPDIADIFDRNDIRLIQVVRHPLDIFVSNLHYIKGLRRHRIHDFIANELQTDEERISALLTGRAAAPYIPSEKERLSGYIGWLKHPGMLTVRFEDLVGSRGGGSDERRDEVLRSVAEHIGVRSPEKLHERPDVPASATFRKGKIYNWDDTLTPEQVAMIGRECGTEIAALGYSLKKPRRLA